MSAQVPTEPSLDHLCRRIQQMISLLEDPSNASLLDPSTNRDQALERLLAPELEHFDTPRLHLVAIPAVLKMAAQDLLWIAAGKDLVEHRRISHHEPLRMSPVSLGLLYLQQQQQGQFEAALATLRRAPEHLSTGTEEHKIVLVMLWSNVLFMRRRHETADLALLDYLTSHTIHRLFGLVAQSVSAVYDERLRMASAILSKLAALTPRQADVLRTLIRAQLEQQGRPVTQEQLAQELGVVKGAIHLHLKALLQKGYVEQHQRHYYAKLTAWGLPI